MIKSGEMKEKEKDKEEKREWWQWKYTSKDKKKICRKKEHLYCLKEDTIDKERKRSNEWIEHLQSWKEKEKDIY